jgi:hypothetical protein
LLEGTDAETGRVGVVAAQVFSMALIAGCDVLSWERRPEAVRYREELLPRSLELYEAITGEAPKIIQRGGSG